MSIELDLTLTTRSNEPDRIYVFITSGDLIQAKVDCFMQMFEQVKTHDSEGKWVISLGYVNHSDREYIE